MASSGKKLARLVEANSLHPDEQLLTIVKGQVIREWSVAQLVVGLVLVASTVLALFVSPAFWFGWLAVVFFISTSTGYGSLAVTDRSLYLVRDGFMRPEVVSSGPLTAEYLSGEKLKTVEVGGVRFKFKAGYEKRFHQALEAIREPGSVG